MMNNSNDNRLDEALEKRIEKMPLERQPERDLWKGIEQALDSETNNKTFVRSAKPIFAVTASFLVLAVVGWMSFESGKSLQGESLVTAMSEQHNSQKQSLLIRFKDQPAMTDNWQQQIEELDEAAEAIKKALAQEPNNPALLKMLKNVYEQQMAIIERVHEPRWNRI
jgi:hypothetical protein